MPRGKIGRPTKTPEQKAAEEQARIAAGLACERRRRALGLTQAQVAGMLATRVEQMSRWECGRVSAPARLLALLAKLETAQAGRVAEPLAG